QRSAVRKPRHNRRGGRGFRRGTQRVTSAASAKTSAPSTVKEHSERDRSMIRRLAAALTLLAFAALAIAFQANHPRHVPTVDDLLTVKSVGVAQISPDGKWIAYTTSYGDFKQDAFIIQIWLVASDSGKS